MLAVSKMYRLHNLIKTVSQNRDRVSFQNISAKVPENLDFSPTHCAAAFLSRCATRDFSFAAAAIVAERATLCLECFSLGGESDDAPLC
jgi:hypothetical protein